MKRIFSWVIAALLVFGVSSVHAADGPFAETAEVYHQVLDNHLSRPSEKQLVQGALEGIKKLAEKESNLSLQYSAEDDTLAELERRLSEWKDKAKLDASTLNRLAIEGMLSTLDDPHTMFFTKDDLELFQAGVENQLVGFGFRMRFQNGLMLIREIIPNSPAAASGLKKEISYWQ